MPVDLGTLASACGDHAVREADTLNGLRGALLQVRAALVSHDMAALGDALAIQAENQRAVDELRRSREALQRQAAARLNLEPASVTLRMLAVHVGGADGERLGRERDHLWHLGVEVERLNAGNAVLARHGLNFVRNLLAGLTGGTPGGDGYGPNGAPRPAGCGSLLRVRG
jgi:hypothetical protein